MRRMLGLVGADIYPWADVDGLFERAARRWHDLAERFASVREGRLVPPQNVSLTPREKRRRIDAAMEELQPHAACPGVTVLLGVLETASQGQPACF